jgi:hypothetical protein
MGFAFSLMMRTRRPLSGTILPSEAVNTSDSAELHKNPIRSAEERRILDDPETSECRGRQAESSDRRGLQVQGGNHG